MLSRQSVWENWGGTKVASADATFGCEFKSDFRRQGVSFEAYLCSPDSPFGEKLGGAKVASADATAGCDFWADFGQINLIC